MNDKNEIDNWFDLGKNGNKLDNEYLFEIKKIKDPELFTRKILKALISVKNGIGPLHYSSKSNKYFKAIYSPKMKRNVGKTPAIKFITTDENGNQTGSTWKCDAYALIYMFKNGSRYGNEGKGGTKGTLHAHALVPLIDKMIKIKKISENDFEYLIEE